MRIPFITPGLILGAVLMFQPGIPGTRAGLPHPVDRGPDSRLEAPVWIEIQKAGGEIHLRWEEVPGALYYKVWRSQSSGSGYDNIGLAESSRYEDGHELEEGRTYFYVLTAMNNEFDETAFSEQKRITY